MPGKVVELGPHENMRPGEALNVVLREEPTDVLILSYTETGSLRIRSSSMKNKDALWMLEHAKQMILEEED